MKSFSFDEAWHKKACKNHSGAYGHYCPEWDELFICEDCPEFQCCTCEFEDAS